jgi:hypothetical protein
MDTDLPMCIWTVAFIRFYLLMASGNASVVIFYLFNAFGKQSEFSAAFGDKKGDKSLGQCHLGGQG